MYETPDKRERTCYTLHLYLNESSEEMPLEGGATTFHSVRSDESKLDVQPKMGSVLIFQQRWLYHAGSEVIKGTKLTMRTELMYQKTDEVAPPRKNANEKNKDLKRTKVKWAKEKLGRSI
jgi:hypothetical protein